MRLIFYRLPDGEAERLGQYEIPKTVNLPGNTKVRMNVNQHADHYANRLRQFQDLEAPSPREVMLRPVEQGAQAPIVQNRIMHLPHQRPDPLNQIEREGETTITDHTIEEGIVSTAAGYGAANLGGTLYVQTGLPAAISSTQATAGAISTAVSTGTGYGAIGSAAWPLGVLTAGPLAGAAIGRYIGDQYGRKGLGTVIGGSCGAAGAGIAVNAGGAATVTPAALASVPTGALSGAIGYLLGLWHNHVWRGCKDKHGRRKPKPGILGTIARGSISGFTIPYGYWKNREGRREFDAALKAERIAARGGYAA